jgi:hypothetical protein
MKSLPYLVAAIFFLSSCSHIYFTEAQAGGGTLLSEVPKELHGKWKIDEKESAKENITEWLTIEKEGYRYFKVVKDSLQKVDTVKTETTLLSDSTKLYVSGKIYIFNYQDENPNWEIVVLEKRANGSIYFYESRDPNFYKRDKNLNLVQAKYTIDEEEKIVKTLDPPYTESANFLHAIFSGQLENKTLHRLTRKKFRLHVLKKNGKVVFSGRKNGNGRG